MRGLSTTIEPSVQRALAWMLLGGLCAGTLDILFATGFWALRGVAPQRILQSVAAGVLGKASFSGGSASALLGLGLHYLIAIAMATAYAMAARDASALLQRPWRYGALYGLVLFAVMSFIVVPLSAAPRSGAPLPLWIASSVIAHVVLVGWPCAWFARRAWLGAWGSPPLATMLERPG
jgi:hypothetical protein